MIGIIIAAPIALSPFAKKYITLLEQRKIPYEIIEWVRSDDKSPSEKYHTFYEHTERYVSIFSKVMPFLHFRKFAKEIIKRQNYDRLIVLK